MFFAKNKNKYPSMESDFFFFFYKVEFLTTLENIFSSFKQKLTSFCYIKTQKKVCHFASPINVS